MTLHEYLEVLHIELKDRHGGGGKLTLVNNWSIGERVSFDLTNNISIGSDTIISEDVKIFTHDHIVGNPLEIRTSPLQIGSNVYIGENTRIYEGCNTIGDGAYIGGCSVVTKDIPANELWAGVPAKKIRDITT